MFSRGIISQKLQKAKMFSVRFKVENIETNDRFAPSEGGMHEALPLNVQLHPRPLLRHKTRDNVGPQAGTRRIPKRERRF